MAVISVIMAGGVGSRISGSVPKQFINIAGKPIISYVLEVFEKSSCVDKIIVPCANFYIEFLSTLCKENNYKKVKKIVEGGGSWLDSAENALASLKNLRDEDIVMFCESVRPMITGDLLLDNAAVCEKYGNAVSASTPYEQIAVTSDGEKSSGFVFRTNSRRLQMPQSYKYALIKECFAKRKTAPEQYNCIDSLMLGLGYNLYFSKGDQNNFKITTQSDVDLFERIIGDKK
jgi:2-C-methyl-D-erythritol 4-phosphate cytidylyltransferase